MNYPLLILKENDKNIYAINNAFGIVSKGGEKFYENTIVIDSKGNLFRTLKVEILGRAKLIYCLRYFQKMIELKIIFADENEIITLHELKELLKNKIMKDKKKWISSYGNISNDILNNVDSKKNYKDLISMFF